MAGEGRAVSGDGGTGRRQRLTDWEDEVVRCSGMYSCGRLTGVGRECFQSRAEGRRCSRSSRGSTESRDEGGLVTAPSPTHGFLALCELFGVETSSLRTREGGASERARVDNGGRDAYTESGRSDAGCWSNLPERTGSECPTYSGLVSETCGERRRFVIGIPCITKYIQA